MKVVYTPAHLAHDPVTETVLGMAIPANEVAERGERIRTALEADGGFEFTSPTEHGDGPITDVHDPGLLRFLAEVWSEARNHGFASASLAADTYPNVRMFEGMSAEALARVREPKSPGGRAGFWGLDTAAPIVPGSYGAARWAVDVALTAMDLVLGGEQAAYGLCRPPGHHAARSMFGGYCFFNNAAIAAHAVSKATGEPVAIIDVDFHHGNGTQQIFWRRGDVLYASIHGHPERQYPYFLGYEDETGEGEGAGTNLNVPLRAGATDSEYLDAVDRCVEAIGRFGGSVVVVSLGFDTYGQDPIGDFALTTSVYHEVGRRVAALGRRLVILQEGGYHRPSLGENARQWLRGATGRELDLRPASGFGAGGTIAGS
jgi:acetoin utilization deacetylase AcuC-like enzyme